MNIVKKLRNTALALVLGSAFYGLQVQAAQNEKSMISYEQKVSDLWDKQEITEVINKFARALDRMDGPLMKSTYWLDAIEEHQDPIYPELFHWKDNGHKFVPLAMKGFESLELTQHRISNILIELDGKTAKAEAYVYAYHVHKDKKGVLHEGILGGRHLFEFVKKEDTWKIQHRVTIFDWNRNNLASAKWSKNFEEKYRGQRNNSDASYNYLKKSIKTQDIVFLVEFNIKPKYRAAFVKSLTKLIDDMSKEDTYVYSYLSQDSKDENKFVIHERWSESSFEAFVNNQLKAKSYRNDYEKNLPKWSKIPRIISVLKPIQ